MKCHDMTKNVKKCDDSFNISTFSDWLHSFSSQGMVCKSTAMWLQKSYCKDD